LRFEDDVKILSNLEDESRGIGKNRRHERSGGPRNGRVKLIVINALIFAGFSESSVAPAAAEGD